MNRNKDKTDIEDFINRTMKDTVVIQSDLPRIKHEEKKSCVDPKVFKPIINRWFEFIKKTNVMNPKWQIRKGKRENSDYEKFIKSKSCLVCGRTPVDGHYTWHRRSDVYSLTPLCREHHTSGPYSYHIMEHEAFEKYHNVNMLEVIYELLTEFIEKELI